MAEPEQREQPEQSEQPETPRERSAGSGGGRGGGGRPRPIRWRSAWWASCGFAAIPTAALDPAHSPASPAVPALIGSGSPSFAVNGYPASLPSAGLISVIAALTAKETKSRSLRNIDDLHTSRTEALEVVALDKRNAAGR